MRIRRDPLDDPLALLERRQPSSGDGPRREDSQAIAYRGRRSRGIVLGPRADPGYSCVLGAIRGLDVDPVAKLLLRHLWVRRSEHGAKRATVVALEHLEEGRDHAVGGDHRLAARE